MNITTTKTKKIFFIIMIVFCMYGTAFPKGLYTAIGFVQNIENGVMTINGIKYYPVSEEISYGDITIGDRLKIQYEANPKGTRYYHAIVKPEDDFPFREDIPPA